MCSVGRFFNKSSQAPQTVVDVGLRLRMFFRSTSTSLPVCPGPFMGVVGLAFEFGGPLARLLRVGTCCFVKCLAVVNLAEGAVQIHPTIGELLGGGDHTLTRGLQLVLRTVLVFWAMSSSSMASHATANSMSPSSVSCVTFVMVSSKVSYSPRDLHGLLLKMVHLDVRFGVLLACGA